MSRKELIREIAVSGVLIAAILTVAALLPGCATATPTEPVLPVAQDRIVRAVCIGWNSVDPAAYDGWTGDKTFRRKETTEGRSKGC